MIELALLGNLVGIVGRRGWVITFPTELLRKGKGVAFAVIDYGEEHNLIWVVALDESGEIWCSPNPKVRMQANWTVGRTVAGSLSVAAE